MNSSIVPFYIASVLYIAIDEDNLPENKTLSISFDEPGKIYPIGYLEDIQQDKKNELLYKKIKNKLLKYKFKNPMILNFQRDK
ncbi:MAG: hypothetical protein KDK45_18060 [Leptospiraceae bacterium]|nr:hypothetical protein [Leptospiraceae bacterium]